MGVPRLTKLVTNKGILLPFDFTSTTNDKVVIDGGGFKYYIYYQTAPKTDTRCFYKAGGEYLAYAAKIRQFFAVLRGCGVTPYVVFDGADDIDGKKTDEHEKRFADRIRKMDRISTDQATDWDSAIPPLAHIVLLNVLQELGVSYAYANFEADNEIAGLANHFNCPVMANDGDFFVMDLNGGYIPFFTFDWDDVGRAQIYSIDEFCKKFGVTRHQLPLFATLVGNDYISAGSMAPFFRNRRLHRALNGRVYDEDLIKILEWLRYQNNARKTVEDSLHCIDQYVSHETQSKMRVSLRMYRPSMESALHMYFEDGTCYVGGLVETSMVRKSPWCVSLLRNGSFPCYLINACTSHRRHTLLQAQDDRMPSSNDASTVLRQILYGILLLDEDYDGRHVEELDREFPGRLKKNLVKPLPLKPKQGVTFADMRSEQWSKQDKEGMLLNALKIQVSRDNLYDRDIPPLLHLPICIAVNWLSHIGPRGHLLDALLLSWIWACLDKYLHHQDGRAFDDAFHQLLQWDKDDVQELCTYLNDTVSVDFLDACDVEKDVMHSLAQFQSITMAAFELNAVFLQPFPVPDIAYLYNGRFIHRLNGILRDVGNAEEWINRAFEGAPGPLKLYRSIRRVLVENISH